MSKHKLNIRQEVILDNGHKFCARTYQEERDMIVSTADIIAAGDKIETVDEDLVPDHFDLCGDSLTLCVKPKVFSLGLITREDFDMYYCIVDRDSLEVKYDRDPFLFGYANPWMRFSGFIENKTMLLTFEQWAEYHKHGKVAQWLQPSLRKEFEAALEYRKERVKLVTSKADDLWFEVDAKQQKQAADLEADFEKYCDWLGWEMYSEKDKP